MLREELDQYQEMLRSNEPVFDGQPLEFFAKMTPRKLYEYKEQHFGFEDSWVFKSILQKNGPVFYLIATTGDDKVPIDK